MNYKVGLYNFPLRWEVEADNEEEAQRKGLEEIRRDMEPESLTAGGFIVVEKDEAEATAFWNEMSKDSLPAEGTPFVGYSKDGEVFKAWRNWLYTTLDGEIGCPGRYGQGYIVTHWIPLPEGSVD